MDSKSVIDKVKELVNKGSVSRILVTKDGKTVLDIPVSVGVVGAVVGLASAKWVLLASVLATIGFGCKVEVIKTDGEVVSVMSDEDSQRIRSKAADVVENVKDTIEETINKD